MKKFLITLASLIFLVLLLIASMQVSYFLKVWDFERNLENNKYKEICLAHSYSVLLSQNNSIKFKDRIIQLQDWNTLASDDGRWIIIGLKSNKEKDVYLIGRNIAEKHFKNTNENFCIKTNMKDKK